MSKLSKFAAISVAAIMSCSAIIPASAMKSATVTISSATATAKTGFVKTDAGYTYLKEGNQVKSAFVKVKDNYYYFRSNGIMVTSWIKLNDTYYKFGADGKMATGWQKIDEKYYYFGSDGKMRKGAVIIGEKKYTFNSAGVWDGTAVAAPKAEAATTSTSKITYGCSAETVISAKGLKSSQYTSQKDFLYYKCKFLGKDAVSMYLFSNNKLVMYATSIMQINLTDAEMLSLKNDLIATYKKSYGKPETATQDGTTMYMWELSNEYIVVGNYKGDSGYAQLITMNIGKDCIEDYLNGTYSFPQIS